MVRGSAATSYTYAATPHFEDAAQPGAEWEQYRVNVSNILRFGLVHRTFVEDPPTPSIYVIWLLGSLGWSFRHASLADLLWNEHLGPNVEVFYLLE